MYLKWLRNILLWWDKTISLLSEKSVLDLWIFDWIVGDHLQCVISAHLTPRSVLCVLVYTVAIAIVRAWHWQMGFWMETAPIYVVYVYVYVVMLFLLFILLPLHLCLPDIDKWVFEWRPRQFMFWSSVNALKHFRFKIIVWRPKIDTDGFSNGYFFAKTWFWQLEIDIILDQT